MALFEFEDGHLVPAQFGYPVAQELGPDLVDAICQQVLQIVSRPLFPVTWRDMTGQDDEETPRLTALDVTGQIVSVEILKELDSETLITSLSRLAEVASISWSDLAAEYPSGPEGFRAGWAQFRDSMPPAVGPGPRLIMVAGDIDPSVRPALSVLATSGVEVHLMNLRQMSNGRLFLDVNAVGPRLYGHAPQLLASATAAPELAAATEQAAPFEESAPAESAIPAPPAEGTEASNEEDSETPTTRPTPKVAPHLREVFTYPMDEEPPAPWKPAAEESSTEDSSGEQPSDEAVEAPRDEAELGEEQPESESEGPGGKIYQAANIGYADRAAPDLARFEEGLRASGNANGHSFTNTVIGHSYGSTTAGKAMTQVAEGTVDNFIMCGSPGSGAESIDQYNVPKGHVYESSIPEGDAVQGLGPDSEYGTNPKKLDGIVHLSGDATDADGYWSWTDSLRRTAGILPFLKMDIDLHSFANHTRYFDDGTRTSQDFSNIIAGGKQTTDEEWAAIEKERGK